VLKALPVAWRRALLLAELDALTAAAIAEVLDASEAAVTTWIEQASAFVGARLADAGITVADRAHPIQMLRRA
jgi:DNA-directed RNA polymerase specialized sigma24 family protein